MTLAYERAWSVSIGTSLIRSAGFGRSNLTVKFEVQKSVEREPNTATVRIANLARDRREEIEQLETPQLELSAGYVDMMDVIFTGDARDIWSEREGSETWTIIEAEDGGTAYRTAEIEESFGDNVPVLTILRACANAMGVGIGNSESIIAAATLDTAGSNFAGGTVLSGPAWRQLDRICRSCSLRWSVQSGVLQLRAAGQPAETTAILLSPGTGLLGSPTRGAKEERTGKVAHSVEALLIPGLYPGRVVQVESRELNGNFLCRRVGFFGESTGEEWKADLECEEY